MGIKEDIINYCFSLGIDTKLAEKLLINGVTNSDLRGIAGLPVGYEDLMRLAIDFSDAIVLSSPNVNQRLLNYAQNSGKPILPYAENNNEAYLEFCNNLLSEDETE